ncbi:hypothetical protein BH18THE1_BH18THE1_10100 [soil metagenome]
MQITSEEFVAASQLQKEFLQNGLRNIVKNSDGVKQAECRYQSDNMPIENFR